jgi:hypothetical protein
MDEDQIKITNMKPVTEMRLWIRFVYMLILTVAWVIAEIVLFSAAILQLLFKAFTGKRIEHITDFGEDLASYMAQIVRFETFVSDDPAFPLAPWPAAQSQQTAVKGSPSASLPASAEAAPKRVKTRTAKPRARRSTADRKVQTERTATTGEKSE